MAPTSSSKPLTLAIVGGGIAGLSLAITLLQYGIDLTIYEAAPHFGEIGYVTSMYELHVRQKLTSYTCF
jgi:2-polyprenyl-6-methoxyphenol hydroxylase-like FAD-dependent oxidoreductase